MRIALLVLVAALALAACGEDDSTGADPPQAVQSAREPTSTKSAGTKVTVRESDFGRMLWGPGRQAIYIFENDEPNRSRCYGECADAWPPVFANGTPVAGDGVRKGLLGTTKRRSGKRQVTYAGKPLYYYANEAPGEVKCHNVNLNGGFWWAVGADGNRLQ